MQLELEIEMEIKIYREIGIEQLGEYLQILHRFKVWPVVSQQFITLQFMCPRPSCLGSGPAPRQVLPAPESSLHWATAVAPAALHGVDLIPVSFRVGRKERVEEQHAMWQISIMATNSMISEPLQDRVCPFPCQCCGPMAALTSGEWQKWH